MRPLVFGDTIGWLNEAKGTRGVVIAGSFGFEDLCSRRFLALLAGRAAAAGLPTLQFDYPGCGDAAGDLHAGSLGSWTASVGAAIECLKGETGVDEVILIGFRLGALLAAQVAVDRCDVAGLALLAPVASGRAFMREQVGLSRMIDAAVPGAPAGSPFDGVEAAGFRLPRTLVEALNALDWPKSGLPGRADALLMTKAESPAEARIEAWLTDACAAVERTRFEGYGRLMCDPTANLLPLGVLDQCAAWLGARSRTAAGDAGPMAGGLPSLSHRPVLAGPSYEEEPVLVGPAPHMVGVLCRPAGAAPTSVGATLILNSGGVAHVGWARGAVETARALAATGESSLRLDLPGLGQSETAPGRRVWLYDRRTRFDVVRAIDFLEARGYRRFGVMGVCAGAFQAFHAARADRRVCHLTMINPLCFAWNASYALDLAVWKTYESSKVALGRSAADVSEMDAEADGHGAGGHGSRGSRLFKRATSALRRGIESVKTVFSTASRLSAVFGNPVERSMKALGARGARVLVVTSAGDLSAVEIARHFGPGGRRLSSMPHVTRLTLEGADHTLTPRPARAAVAARLAAHAAGDVACGARQPAEDAGEASGGAGKAEQAFA